MPHRGVSCHLFDDDVPSFFKNLLQKGEEGELDQIPSAQMAQPPVRGITALL
jgi:hypothetical protein